MEDALAGSLAGLIAVAVTHPLDTLKVRQITGLQLGSMTGLYRGFGCVATMSTVGNGIYFGSYEWAKQRLQSRGFGEIAAPFLGGIAANTATLLVWVPQDVIKERQQVFTSSEYRSVLSSARTLIKSYGPTGLYRGFGWSFLTYTPLCALYFVFYEAYKKRVAESLQADPEDLGTLLYALGGAVCGGAAAALTTPLDVLKVTVQVGEGRAWDAARRPFRGMGYRVATIAPTYALTIAMWENCRQLFAGQV
eukprot:TRINITY_DN50856_c0_g1_i1.p1 TRINITY_DN50856_c0_g1~~TRINITY_DN50856_c0_g1_i1.p1  ORF type:complete len:269 (+),score=65.03 TRINITY_DN50856_c0_g1_i1:58-807(+)